MPRMACVAEGCGFVHWDNPTPVVAAVVEHEGQIILARNKLWPVSFYALITGFLERTDPSPHEAVQREVAEELGLQPRVRISSGITHFKSKTRSFWPITCQLRVRLCSTKNWLTTNGSILNEPSTGPQRRGWPCAIGSYNAATNLESWNCRNSEV